MPKRRASGDGTLRKRSDGRWEGRLVVGTMENGLPLFKCFLAKNKKEVLRQMDRFKENLKGVTLCEGYRMTLAAWLDKWLCEHMAFNLRDSTKESYQRYINSINRYLGHKQVSAITTADVQKMYNKLKVEGRVREHPHDAPRGDGIRPARAHDPQKSYGRHNNPKGCAEGDAGAERGADTDVSESD